MRTVVGTVVGTTTPREFYFTVTPGEVQLQDIVCVDVQPAKAEGADDEVERVWAKVVEIERINPLFPEEAAQEISNLRLSAYDTVVSLSREMVTAKCIVLGKEKKREDGVELVPLTYPVRPASSVYVGEPDSVRMVFSGNIPPYRRLRIGHLRGRPEFPVHIDAHAIVARHLGVLAATGAGKTVTVRKIIEELALNTQYPLLIFDPHSDYIGLGEVEGLKDRVVVYFPAFHPAEEETDSLIRMVSDLSDEELSPAQESILRDLIELVKSEWITSGGVRWNDQKQEWVVAGAGWKKDGIIHKFVCPKAKRPYCFSLDSHHFYCFQEILDTIAGFTNGEEYNRVKTALEESGLSAIVPGSFRLSHSPLRRQLGKAATAYRTIREMNRIRLAEIKEAKSLPGPSQVEKVIEKGKIAVVSLEGFSKHAAAVVANLMRQLLELRLQDKIHRFLTVVEEAHNFVPGALGEEESSPSLEIFRQIATEGRKYGMGLVLISQRPSRVNATVLAQCNSFVVLRIVNPADQKFVRETVESLGAEDAKLLPDLATGEALVTGECVRFPVLVQIEKPRSTGRHEEEDFVKEFVV